MSSSPKAKRRLCGTALGNAELMGAYRVLALLQAPFGFVFWLLEQTKAKLQDRIDNEGSEP
jgi:hypothetical protein